MTTTDVTDFALTDNAIEHISAILADEKEGTFFRVAVQGGGCSGFSYEFDVDHTLTDEDIIYPCGDYKVVIDSTSIAFVKGSVLDYVTQMIGSQFEIKNPNAKSSCGCGVSFSL